MSKKSNGRILIVVLVWSAVAALLAFLLSLAASALLLSETIGQGSAGYLAWGIMLFSVFAAALAGSKSVVRDKRFITALCIGVAFFLYTVLVKLLVFPGTFQNVWLNLLLCVVGAFAAFALTVGKKKRSASKVRIRR